MNGGREVFFLVPERSIKLSGFINASRYPVGKESIALAKSYHLLFIFSSLLHAFKLDPFTYTEKR
jgi:hypothetical protein